MKKVNKFDGRIFCDIDDNNNLQFYWAVNGKIFYLFTQKFTRAVYFFFRNGVRDFELFRYKHWGINPRLDKTVDKIPIYLSYILRNVA